MTIRVAVVDDQALVRRGFALVLDHQEDIEVVAEAGTGLEAVEAEQEESELESGEVPEEA